MNKNIKFTMLAALSLCLFTACSAKVNKPIAENNYYNAYANIDKEDILVTVSQADIDGDPSDVSDIYERSEIVAIATVTSIDGGNNFNEFTGDFIYPFTYGKLSVQRVFKGNIAEDTEINYVRMGGIIPYQNYYSSLSISQKQKRDAMPGGHPPYVKMIFGEDIEIETGKTYLVYLIESAAKKDSYSIIGWQGGLREVKNDNTLKSDVTKIEVYNNYTNSWDNIESIVP